MVHLWRDKWTALSGPLERASAVLSVLPEGSSSVRDMNAVHLHPYLCQRILIKYIALERLYELNIFDEEPRSTGAGLGAREFIDCKTSMITDEDPLRGLLYY